MKARIALLLSPVCLVLGFGVGRWSAPGKLGESLGGSPESIETALTGEGNPGFSIQNVTFKDHRLRPLDGTTEGNYYLEREFAVTYVNDNSLTRAFEVRATNGVQTHTVILPPTGKSGAQTVYGRMSIQFAGETVPEFVGSGSGFEARFPSGKLDRHNKS